MIVRIPSRDHLADPQLYIVVEAACVGVGRGRSRNRPAGRRREGSAPRWGNLLGRVELGATITDITQSGDIIPPESALDRQIVLHRVRGADARISRPRELSKRSRDIEGAGRE